MGVIHKAARPAKDYCDPTMCKVSHYPPWVTRRSDRNTFAFRVMSRTRWDKVSHYPPWVTLCSDWNTFAFHAMSRTRWDKVTCKRCLRFKGKRRKFL